GQTTGSRNVLRVGLLALLEHGLDPRQHLWLSRVHASRRSPHAGEIGLTVQSSGSWTCRRRFARQRLRGKSAIAYGAQIGILQPGIDARRLSSFDRQILL